MSFTLDDLPSGVNEELTHLFGPTWHLDEKCIPNIVGWMLINMGRQKRLDVKIRKMQPDVFVPRYANAGDAGLDFVATSFKKDGQCYVYGTGISIEIPEGHVGLLFPRSSLSKKDLMLTNKVGVIDSGYRGEILFKFKEFYDVTDVALSEKPLNIYEIGEKIGQLIIVPYPYVNFILSNELSESERGASGYGSTGN